MKDSLKQDGIPQSVYAAPEPTEFEEPTPVRLLDDTPVGTHNIRFRTKDRGVFSLLGRNYTVQRLTSTDLHVVILSESAIPGYSLVAEAD